MKNTPQQLTLEEWDTHYEGLKDSGFDEPSYGGRLSRHVDDGDFKLRKLSFDNSPAALDLWNFLLTEEDRLRGARSEGKKIVGTMKDLGTVPVMSYAFPELTAFYPDGAWWIPCIMELSAGLLDIADSMGIDESFCPVRAMLGAFSTGAHFPIPDVLICSVGATCDDFSAIAQRLNGMGHTIHWWEIPHRRTPDQDEENVPLPGGLSAPCEQEDLVRSELEGIKDTLEKLAGRELTDEALSEGIESANEFRSLLNELREQAFTAERAPLPALELLIAEMIAIHFCSDREESIRVIRSLLDTVCDRVRSGEGYFEKNAVRVFWVNPVADIQAMNILEECGGRVCGTEYLFSHALDLIQTDIDPMSALARTALADPMIGSSSERADRICRDIRKFGSEALIISRVPGASHCALESGVIADIVSQQLDIPVLSLEVPPLSGPLQPAIRTRIEGLIETARGSR